MELNNNFWLQVLNIIQKSVNNQVFEMWFKTTFFISFNNNILKIGIPNIFFKNWLEKKYKNLILEIVTNLSNNEEIQLEFIVQPKEEELNLEGISKNSLFFDQFNPKYTFENFVVGPSNKFAHAASLAVAESPAYSYNPLFIYGGVGLGKTHLMQAIGHFIINTRKNIKVVYLSTEKFMNELINSIQQKTTHEFRSKYRNIDVLLIDDIQFLANKEMTQLEFFHTFNELHNAHHQIVITCDSPPHNIPTLEERLISRFEWGLITDIQPPDFETRVAILKNKLKMIPFSLDEEIIFFISDKFKSNIRELEGALVKIVAYIQLNKIKEVTLEIVKEILKDIIPDKEEVNIDLIQNIVCNYFQIDLKKMLSKERTKNIVYPRQIAMYLSRELTNLSLPEIGKKFGGRDHTTILHAYNLINRKISSDRKELNLITNLKKEINK